MRRRNESAGALGVVQRVSVAAELGAGGGVRFLVAVLPAVPVAVLIAGFLAQLQAVGMAAVVPGFHLPFPLQQFGQVVSHLVGHLRQVDPRFGHTGRRA